MNNTTVKILRDDGSQAEPGESGRIVCRLPLAPGTFITLYNADDRYQKTYFSKYPGYYDTMDAGMIDENGYVFITGREDDVINVDTLTNFKLDLITNWVIIT